ncbi:MAG: nitrogenase [Deltaproteobacteria bacterium]|jgi:nitrogenase molybdenum-iron protein beta chain|nr:nitrogenase [Deltaproteobacteria bacterium]
MAFTLVNGESGETEKKYCEFPEVAESPRFTCALGGAYGATLATFGAVPILHSGLGCGMANAHGMTYASGLNSGGTQGTTTTPCSGLIEEHVVFGGEDKLRRLIDSTLKIMKGELFVVISGCIPALIGDDVDSVVSEFQDRAKVIHVKTSGFIGNGYVGYNLYLDSLINNLVTEKPTEKKLVNLLGIIPNQNPFWKGEIKEVKELLENIGVKVNTIFTDFDSVGAIEKIGAASLNLVFNPWAGVAAAKKLEERLGIPYLNFNFVPMGPKESSNFLRAVGQKLKIPKTKVEGYIKSAELSAYRYMEYLAEFLMISCPHAFLAVVGDSASSISFLRYGVNELGWNPELVIVTDNPPEDSHAVIRELLTQDLQGVFQPEVIFDFDSHRIREHLNQKTLQVILASSLEKYVHGKNNEAFHLSIAYPIYDRLIVDRNYTGYRGGINLLEDMSHSFAGPL